MKLTYFIGSLFFVSTVFAQNPVGSEVADGTIISNNSSKSVGTAVVADDSSIIKGTVIEEATGKPLPGVNITVVGTPLATTSDAEGHFSFRKMEIGKYNLEFSMFSFETKIISEVEVLKGEATTLTVSLSEKNNVLNEVVIRTVKAKTESVNSLLTVQKNSVRVSDGISAETIKKTPDRTASDVLKRISGASIQNNKFVIIRGLNDRYNTTYLNGSPLPSTEPDRKAFSFDIFPSNMLDNLVIYKTASPDLPGEFAGGVIDINTKSTPDKNFQSISVGAGYNTITTNKNKLESNDIKASLPSSFPSSVDFMALQAQRNESSVQQIATLAKNYQTDWSLNEDKFAPNTSFQVTLGRYFKFKGEQSLGLLASLTNNVSNNYNETIRNTYETPGDNKENFLDKTYSVQKLTGAILNLSFKLNTNNKFSFKNLYSQTTESRITDKIGREEAITEDLPEPTIFNITSRLYTKNKIYTGQLIGEHFLPESKIKLNWVGSYSNVNRSIPNERTNLYDLTTTPNVPTATFDTTNIGSKYSGFTFVSTNDENIYSAKVDVSKKINFSDDFSADFKIGGITQSRKREFEARQLGYVIFTGRVDGVTYGRGTFDKAIPVIPTQSDATIFNASNMGILGSGSSGLTLKEDTKGSDTYDAKSNLDAAYLMIDNVFNKFRVVWGVRMENYSQRLNSKTDVGEIITVDDSRLDVLPSVNFIYSLTKKQNLRLSGSKTLNRPEFRELAPFLFFDNATRFSTEGTPTLKITDILNGDLRYEYFPGSGQMFSISAFYKEFKNPIELQAMANNSNKYQNANSGTNYGVELEFRTLLSSILGTKEIKILEDLTLFSNLAVIRSKVVSSFFTNATPMQGQSPYVFNAGLQYINKEFGWSFSGNMNRIGDRISIHGNQTEFNEVHAFWEKARTILDFQVAKTLLKNKLELKLNLQNLLAQDLIFYQNNDAISTTTPTKIKGLNSLMNSIFIGDGQNKNGFDSKVDDLVWKTKLGQTFSFTMTYNF